MQLRSVKDEKHATVAVTSASGRWFKRSTHDHPLPFVIESVGLTVEVATTIEGLRELAFDYERLQIVTANTLPFALHDWHVAWCEQFLRIDKHLYMQPMIHVVRNRENACVAIVPLILTRRAIGPVKLASLDLVGTDPAITEIRGSLVEAGYEARAAWAVQQALANARLADWVHWSGASGTFGAALGLGAALRWQEPLLDYVLDLPQSWELLHAKLKRNIRESIRHCYNSLKREGAAYQLRIAQHPDTVKDALQRFFRLHTSRANLAGAVKHPDYFANAVSRRFLLMVCERLAQRGVVRIFELAIGEEVVASRIGFVVGNSLYLYYSGFDPRWAKYSVMTTTLVETIKYAIAQGYSSVNFSPGKDISKTRWSPREIQIAQAVQMSPSWWSRQAWNLFRRAKSGALPQMALKRWAQRAKHKWT